MNSLRGENLSLFESAAEPSSLRPPTSSPPLTDERSALDELFQASIAYRKSKSYWELLQFISRFPRYSPYNCFLLHMQNPNLSYVATPGQWQKRFGRRIKPDARPMIILAPMTPVLFVYDMADTEGKPMPSDLERPFDTQGDLPAKVWDHTLSNCERDRIAVIQKQLSVLHGGSAMRLHPANKVLVGKEHLPAKHVIQLNSRLKITDRYSTLVHELAHIHCGHLGSDTDPWWPDRRGVTREQREFEAESVSYLVCRRLGLETTSAEYLAGYAEANTEVPLISLDTVLGVAGYIETMGQRVLPERKKK